MGKYNYNMKTITFTPVHAGQFLLIHININDVNEGGA